MIKIESIIKRIIQFITQDIWTITYGEISKSKLFLYSTIKTIILAMKGYDKHRLGIRAAALTYAISFAIVPLFALIIAIAKGFGVEKLIEHFLEKIFIAQSELIPTTMVFVEKYLATMQNGLFIGIGVLILLWSVMNLFMQIENSLNDIWEVKKSRAFFKQFTNYFTGVVVFPFLITILSGASIYLNTVLSKTFLFEVFSPLMKFLVHFIPYFASSIVFTLAYKFIPNTKVKFVNALIAGVVAGSMFQLFQTLYINGQINLTRYNAIYGGFAAIPLLLLWLSISCQIFFIGAEISYNSQNLRNFDFDIDTRNISHRYKESLTVYIAYLIIKRFEEGLPPTSVDTIVEEKKMPIRLVNQIINTLKKAGIIVDVKNSKNESGYFPAMDINKLTLNMVLSQIDTQGSEQFLEPINKELDIFNAKMNQLYEKSDELTKSMLIKDL